MSILSKISKKTVDRFLNAWHGPAGTLAPMLIENPTEELDDAIARGKLSTRVHYAIPGQARGVQALQSLADNRGDIRGEENYLFSTRRYPQAADNLFGAVTGNMIPPGQYQYFSYAVNQSAGSAGFPTTIAPPFTASTNETNLFGTPNVVPNGQGFQIERESIGFNTEAKAEDIEQILDSGDFQYQTQSAQYTLFKGPLAGWPGGIGVSGFSTNQNTEAAHNGIADLRAVRALKVPRIIKPQQQFSYMHNVGITGRATDGSVWSLSGFTLCRVMLWGVMLTKQTS